MNNTRSKLWAADISDAYESGDTESLGRIFDALQHCIDVAFETGGIEEFHNEAQLACRNAAAALLARLGGNISLALSHEAALDRYFADNGV